MFFFSKNFLISSGIFSIGSKVFVGNSPCFFCNSSFFLCFSSSERALILSSFFLASFVISVNLTFTSFVTNSSLLFGCCLYFALRKCIAKSLFRIANASNPLILSAFAF